MNQISLVASPPTRPPTPENDASCRFRLAVNRPGTDAADFVPVVAFDKLAQVVGDHLVKGRLVSVAGRLRSSEWTTPDGDKRYALEIIAEHIGFLDRKKPTEAAEDPAAA